MSNQELYKTEVDVYLTREKASHPSIAACRYAALQVKNSGYVVYDRLMCRIVNGVFYVLEDALGVAELYNEGHGPADMSPNGAALGLHYPTKRA